MNLRVYPVLHSSLPSILVGLECISRFSRDERRIPYQTRKIRRHLFGHDPSPDRRDQKNASTEFQCLIVREEDAKACLQAMMDHVMSFFNQCWKMSNTRVGLETFRQIKVQVFAFPVDHGSHCEVRDVFIEVWYPWSSLIVGRLNTHRADETGRVFKELASFIELLKVSFNVKPMEYLADSPITPNQVLAFISGMDTQATIAGLLESSSIGTAKAS